jgi:hypothetical protein
MSKRITDKKFEAILRWFDQLTEREARDVLFAEINRRLAERG